MPFVHECPSCSKRSKVKDEMRGRKVKCPDCGEPNVLGGGGKPAKKRSASKAAAAAPAMGGLPPVVNQKKAQAVVAARRKAAAKEEADSTDYDGLYGRSDTLGKVDEEEFAKEQKQQRMILGGFALALIALFGGYLYTSDVFAGPEAFMPKQFTRVDGPDEKYSVEVPDGWEVETQRGGGNKSPFLRAKNKKISINIKPNIMATLTGDVAASTNDLFANMAPGGVLPDEMQPVHQMHEKIKDSYGGAYNDYQEGPIKVLGAGASGMRYSRYDGRTPIGLREYGFRGTIMIGPLAHIVDARMPKSYLDEFEPHFRKVLQSIQ